MPNERPHLIVLEDDPVTRSMIAGYFAREGFSVDEAGSGSEFKALLKQKTPDLAFIDIQLPDCNGLALAQEIRTASPVGIIFVTQRDSETDRVAGLELAGDDYVTKPVNLRELLARARALLRRRSLKPEAVRNPVLTFGPWLLDLTRRELAPHNGDPIRLTRAEFDLLAALVDARGQPLSRDYLIEVVSNRDTMVDARTVDSLVARLRRKLVSGETDGPVIVTVAGVGYKIGITVA